MRSAGKWNGSLGRAPSPRGIVSGTNRVEMGRIVSDVSTIPMHKVTTFDEIHMKFVRNSYEIHVNPSELFQNKNLTFALVLVGPSKASIDPSSGVTAHPVQCPLVLLDTGFGLRPHQSKRIWDTSQGLAHQRANKIQTVLKFVLGKFSQSGGGVPHMLLKLLMPGGGGGCRQNLCIYVYVHIFIYKYVQITSVQVRWDERSRSQRESYAPPPP